eukprot:364500-Chlamydomonas_euryale.AAC.1
MVGCLGQNYCASRHALSTASTANQQQPPPPPPPPPPPHVQTRGCAPHPPPHNRRAAAMRAPPAPPIPSSPLPNPTHFHLYSRAPHPPPNPQGRGRARTTGAVYFCILQAGDCGDTQMHAKSSAEEAAMQRALTARKRRGDPCDALMSID